MTTPVRLSLVAPTAGRYRGAVRRIRSRTAPTSLRKCSRSSGSFVRRAEALPTGEQLVAMRQMIDQLEGLWLAAAADFSESGELAETGHPTLASWMRHRCNLAPAEATSRAKVAFAITASQPITGQAVRTGDVSWRHAQVIERALRAGSG